jgi:quercetin dioxygenase-like cupin family protein
MPASSETFAPLPPDDRSRSGHRSAQSGPGPASYRTGWRYLHDCGSRRSHSRPVHHHRHARFARWRTSAPHHHSNSAFIYAYVVSGQIASQVEGQPERIYHAGECWYEMPGAHHLISRNASNTEPAKLLAVFVADTGDNALTVPDHEGGSR